MLQWQIVYYFLNIMFMNRKNKKISVALTSVLFLSPALAMADDTTVSNTTAITTSTTSWEVKSNTWNLIVPPVIKDPALPKPVSWDAKITKINLTSEQQAQIAELKKSFENEINTLKSSVTKENIEEIKAKALEIKKNYIEKFKSLNIDVSIYVQAIEERVNYFIKNISWITTQIQNELTTEQQAQLTELKSALEKELLELKSSITKENLSEIKAKYQEIKAKYQEKLKILFPNNENALRLVNEKFQIFEKANFQAIVNNLKDKVDNAKEKLDTTKEKIEKAKQKLEESKQKTQTSKVNNELVGKYKKVFEEKYKEKIAKLSQEKLKTILVVIDKNIADLSSSTSTKKDATIAQLTALKWVINDVLAESSIEIDIESLLGE